MREAWALRYDCYSHYGFLAQSADAMFSDEYDEYPTSQTVVLYSDGIPAGSVRVCLHDPEMAKRGKYTMPVMATFPDIIPAIIDQSSNRAQSSTAVEILRLVAHPRYENNLQIVFGLFRMAKYLMKMFDAKIVFCAVRPNHISLYRRTGLIKVAEPRHYYEKLSFSTALMLGIEREFDLVQNKIPCFMNVHKHDPIYQSLLEGQCVPVYLDGRSSLSEMAVMPEVEAISMAA